MLWFIKVNNTTTTLASNIIYIDVFVTTNWNNALIKNM